MPAALLDITGDLRGKPDSHLIERIAPVNAEMAAGQPAEVKALRYGKGLGQHLNSDPPGETEGADLPAEMAVGHQVPVSLKTDTVVGVQIAQLCFATRGLVAYLQAAG